MSRTFVFGADYEASPDYRQAARLERLAPHADTPGCCTTCGWLWSRDGACTSCGVELEHVAASPVGTLQVAA